MQNTRFGLKCQKGGKNDCTSTLEFLCTENLSKKHVFFEKWKHFENGQNLLRRKGYSPCQVVSFGQKLKI